MLGVGPADDDAAARRRRSAPSSSRRSAGSRTRSSPSPEVGRLLDELAGSRRSTSTTRSRRASSASPGATGRRRARCRPSCAPRCRASARSRIPVWVEARESNDFESFLPALRDEPRAPQRYIECFDGDYDEPYDAVLDDYERGMKTAEVRALFEYLKEHQSPLVQAVADAGRCRSRPRGRSRSSSQKQFELEVVRRFGFDDDVVAARPDRPSVRKWRGHRRTSESRRATSRTTSTACSRRCTSAGHGLYEHQIDPRSSARRSHAAPRSACTSRRAGCGRTSSGVRCRSGGFFFPRLQELFPDALARLRRRALVSRGQRRRAVADPRRGGRGHLQPAHHPALRARAGAARRTFPLEQLPEEWNRRMWELPRHRSARRHARRAPGHALVERGARLLPDLRARQPDLGAALGEGDGRAPRPDEAFERGEFGDLREWLRENLHRHGRKFTPAETLERAAGASRIDPEPYVRYLRQKVGDIYGLRLDVPA